MLVRFIELLVVISSLPVVINAISQSIKEDWIRGRLVRVMPKIFFHSINDQLLNLWTLDAAYVPGYLKYHLTFIRNGLVQLLVNNFLQIKMERKWRCRSRQWLERAAGKCRFGKCKFEFVT